MGFLTLVLIGSQIGVIGGVSGLVAPTVFRALEASAAGAFLRRLFPRYFVTAAVLGLLASVLAVLGDELLVASIMGANGLCFVAARALIPAINAAKDREDPSFALLHLISVLLNTGGLILAIGAVSVLGAA